MVGIYICKDCKTLFETPKVWYETHGAENPLYYEKFTGCPECMESDFVNAFRCSICDEYILDKYIETENGHSICDECYVVKDL